MSFYRRFALAALSGGLIAWVLTALVLHATFAIGGYTREALVELPPWAFGTIGAAGALVALGAATFTGRTPLPVSVRPVVMGSLAGVAAIVVATLSIACVLGGGSSKGQAPYLHAGLEIGVPVGLIAGAVGGLVVSRHRGRA